jgi:hypothetical protein
MDEARAVELDTSLKRLHGGSNARVLSGLHEEAATLMNAPEARRFHLTHAWIYALVTGNEKDIRCLEGDLRALGGL